MNQFPTSVIEKIGHYVYILIDPSDKQVFYIGKGVGNRVFNHANAALKVAVKSDKLDRIRVIKKRGDEVNYVIHRHGLTEKEAIEVEAALIDYAGLSELTNKVYGHDTEERGRMNLVDIIGKYESEPADIKEPCLLITLNKAYRYGIGQDELYEFTRGRWRLGPKREKARYAFAVYRGIIRQVYEIQAWRPATAESDVRVGWRKKQTLMLAGNESERWEFVGRVATGLRRYLGMSVDHYRKKGSQSPVVYLNCTPGTHRETVVKKAVSNPDSEFVSQILHRSIGINITRSFPLADSPEKLYEFTRGAWRVDAVRVEKAEIAFAVYKGRIVEVYEIESWHRGGTTPYHTDRGFYGDDLSRRWEFVGKIAAPTIRSRYIDKRIAERSWGQPIRYFNC